MGVGDVAKAALEKATEAYTTIIEVNTAIEYLAKDVDRFKNYVSAQADRQQSNQSERHDAHRKETNEILRNFDDRLRALESLMAKVEAKVDGRIVEASATRIQDATKSSTDGEGSERLPKSKPELEFAAELAFAAGKIFSTAVGAILGKASQSVPQKEDADVPDERDSSGHDYDGTEASEARATPESRTRAQEGRR